jgi:hypothetical protein
MMLRTSRRLMFVKVLAPGFKGIFLVLEPFGKFAVVGAGGRPSEAGWVQGVPAGVRATREEML